MADALQAREREQAAAEQRAQASQRDEHVDLPGRIPAEYVYTPSSESANPPPMPP